MMFSPYPSECCGEPQLPSHWAIACHRLTRRNFNLHSLDQFIRHQTVQEAWRRVGGQWKLVPVSFEENWSIETLRKHAADILAHAERDWTVFGAFSGYELVGFIIIGHQVFGTVARYVELICLQVTEPWRGRGIGRRLLSQAIDELPALGADRLYISARSSRESVAAYRAMGCIPAEEINERLAAAEPFDVPLEFRLV